MVSVPFVDNTSLRLVGEPGDCLGADAAGVLSVVRAVVVFVSAQMFRARKLLSLDGPASSEQENHRAAAELFELPMCCLDKYCSQKLRGLYSGAAEWPASICGPCCLRGGSSAGFPAFT